MPIFYSLLHRLNGLEVMVECEQSVLESPPSLGSIITVKYSGISSSGKLKKPIFWRERHDNLLPTNSQVGVQFSGAVWTKRENHRLFFDCPGKELGFNIP